MGQNLVHFYTWFKILQISLLGSKFGRFFYLVQSFVIMAQNILDFSTWAKFLKSFFTWVRIFGKVFYSGTKSNCFCYLGQVHQLIDLKKVKKATKNTRQTFLTFRPSKPHQPTIQTSQLWSPLPLTKVQTLNQTSKKIGCISSIIHVNWLFPFT